MARITSRWFENLFVLLLLGFLIVVNLAGLWMQRHIRQSYQHEHEEHHRAEVRLLLDRVQVKMLRYGEPGLTEANLQELLQRQDTRAAIGVYRLDGTLLARAATADAKDLFDGLPGNFNQPATASKPILLEKSSAEDDFTPAISVLKQPFTDSQGQVFGTIQVIYSVGKATFPEVASRVIYELPLWLVGILVLYWLGRQMLNSLRNQPAAVSAGQVGEPGEMQLVMDSYQHMINRLQSHGKELEREREAERVRAESSEQFSDRLVVSIPSALIVVTNDNLVSITNRQARELFGNPELKPGMAAYQDFFAVAPDVVGLIAKAFQTGESLHQSEVPAMLGGHARFLDVSVSPIPGRTEGWQGVLCLVNESTEMVELRAGMQLRETLASLGEMAAGIAHEFKNSLAAISGYAQLIERDAEERNARPAQALRHEVTYLTKLVTDFLAFARPHEVVFKPVDLGELLEDCCERVRPEAEKRNVTLTLGNHFPVVPGDSTLLGRAFLNLLQNAIEAISTEAAIRNVTVSCQTGATIETQAGECIVQVADTGEGIPENELANVFIPFFTTKTRGYGIGLAIVQKVFVGHNGRVEVESRVGHGTTFTCYLPTQKREF
ncbi:MAG: hypothetical protein K1Y36_20540 [Blastocatellia bacterium]|nr:hypothetical protein [Blastocatellia bacterium]